MRIQRLTEISSEIPVASMSDIAFLLIVFFMIVSVFSLEAGFLLKLPDKDQPPLKVADKKIIEVRIGEDNCLTLDQKTVTFAELNACLEHENSHELQYVAIKAHGQSQYKIVVAVIECFRRRGFDKISLKRLGP
ncbi:biopolymer transporter ExbD [candidate division FCPU426 bacterium]|nr:biopolymer transporter ExbD [candidate division FCPU426 bacterium]